MEKLSALGAAGGGARSYSDFMRSLAAKYNNNEYFPPPAPGSSPPHPAPTIKQDLFPFLGLGGAFPQGFPGLSLPGLPPGFNPFLPPSDKTPGPPTSQPESLKRSRDQGDPLDLTEKRVKTEADLGERRNSSPSSPPSAPSPSPSSPPPPSPSPGLEDWSVEQVVTFVMEIDICREYGQVFRDNKIDGGCLPLLTESHLTAGLGLKLGPALKLLTALRKKLGGPVSSGRGCVQCAHCHPLPGPREEEPGEG